VFVASGVDSVSVTAPVRSTTPRKFESLLPELRPADEHRKRRNVPSCKRRQGEEIMVS